MILITESTSCKFNQCWNTGIWGRKHYIIIAGKLAVEETMDLPQNRISS